MSHSIISIDLQYLNHSIFANEREMSNRIMSVELQK